MPMTTGSWDWQGVSRDFFQVAQEAYRHAGECRMKPGDARSRIEYDRSIAKFSVYSHLYDKSFLARPEDLVAELRRMLDDPVAQMPTGVADAEFFQQCRVLWIRNLIGELESRP